MFCHGNIFEKVQNGPVKDVWIAQLDTTWSTMYDKTYSEFFISSQWRVNVKLEQMDNKWSLSCIMCERNYGLLEEPRIVLKM